MNMIHIATAEWVCIQRPAGTSSIHSKHETDEHVKKKILVATFYARLQNTL